MEFHIWLHTEIWSYSICATYLDTDISLKNKEPIIHTTQTHFCSTKRFEEGYRLFVHLIDGNTVEIKLGENDCTSKEIRMEHNLEKLLLANEFGVATIGGN